MIVNKKDLIFNINTLVCLPKQYEDMAYIYEYNFKYVYIFENTIEGTNKFIEFVNLNNIKEIVLVDYRLEYETIINSLKDNVKINVLVTFDLASLSVDSFLYFHDAIVELYKNGKIDKLGILDKNLFIITKPQFENTFYIKLDVPKSKEVMKDNKEGIGLINISDDPKHSYFNELSAISLLDEKVNVINIGGDVKNFVKEFNINAVEIKKLDDIIENSEIVMYINFCNNDTSLFVKSMDRGTICLLGNNSIIDENEILTKYLQLKSDDDINEIAQKVKDVRENRDFIFEEYNKFRESFTVESKESISDFVIGNKEMDIKTDYEKLLTVGIPVYNVEKYVGATIESVINAIDDDTEILIVNDGSTDGSEEVVLKYKNKYPEIIRYIKQENHGLGNARNVIMENAKGKYIASIDSDDTINKNFFKEAKPYLLENVDIVLCDWLSIYGENEKYPTEALDNGLNFESNYKKLLYSTIMPSNCNKIIKKDMYNEIGLKFIEGLKFEDLGTNPIIMNNAQTIKYINKPYYEYNIRENSIMRTKIGYNMIDILRLLEDRIRKYVNINYFNYDEFVSYVYLWRVEESILNQLYKLEDKDRNEMIDYIYDNMKDILENLYKNNNYTNKLISRVDEDTKNYIHERNRELLENNFKKFIAENIENKTYKILTPALILYNYDNR